MENQLLLMWLQIWKSEIPADLKIHENQDQNEISFTCIQCASKFTNPANLKIHENKDQHENPFSFNVIQLQIRKSKNLKMHENQD